jgi:hypothetical protein
MSSLLFDEPPLVVSPTLACAIGLQEAIVLQQIHYWSSHSKCLHEGRKWVYNTYEEWAVQFPFWKPESIRKIVANLRAQGLVDVEKLSDDKANRTNYYAINYERLRELSAKKTHPEESTAPPSGKNHRMLNRKNPPVQPEESTACLYRTETTTENTKTTGAPRPSLPEWLDPQLWEKWVQHRKEKKKPMTASSAELNIEKLARYREEGFSPKAVIEHSIAGSFQGLYAPRSDTMLVSSKGKKSLDSMDYSTDFFS